MISDVLCKKDIVLIWNGSVNGIDLNYFDPEISDLKSIRSSYGIQEDDFVFGFIGRLVGDKGINELVAAFKKINIQNSNTKLLLIGRFENDLDPLEELTIQEIENNKDIIHAGFQKDVRPFFKAMDVFVFPSYREGFGIVLMEAGAMNVPSISSDIIGCNEIIVNNINGFLIRSRDEIKLNQKMAFCFNNKEKLKKMSVSARNSIIENFEQQKLWQKSLEVYQKIVNSQY